MTKYNAIVYEGIASSFTIEKYPRRNQLELKRSVPYRFTEDDILDDQAINHYNKYRRIGVSLVNIGEPSVIKKTPKVADNPEKVEDSVLNEIDSEEHISEDAKNQLNSLEVEEPELPEEPKEVPEMVEIPDDATEETTEESKEVSDEYDAELSEFLDMTYDAGQLRELAGDLGVSVRANARKATVISALLSEKRDEILKLAE